MNTTLLSLFASCLLLSACSSQPAGPQVVAHRGYWKAEGAAQNSIASLQAAGRIGAYGSEFDVNLTADGALIVNHDFTFKGMTIYETPLADLRRNTLQLKNGEIVPTLDEYLEASLAYPELKLVFELKSKGDPDYEAVAIPASIEAIQRYGVAERVEFISFSLSACEAFARLMPKNRVEYLGGELSPAEVNAKGINGIDYHYSVFDKHPEWVAEAHSLGMIVNVWTVDKKEDMIRMLDLGVDHITTNEPELAQRLIAERKATAGPRQ
jgi:glycerophosphoryl diester phosphodiesterase